MMIDKITKVLRETKGEDDLQVTPDTTFESLELDSLDLTQLVMDLEDEFDGVTIEVSESIKTVGDLMVLIEKAVNE